MHLIQLNKEFVVAIAISSHPALEPVLAQGPLEKAFPQGLEACTERVRFSKAEAGREPPDGGFAMKRGILTGALAERELYKYGAGGGFTIDLARVVNEILAERRLGRFPAEWLSELTPSATRRVRQYQSQFPPEDRDLDWSAVSSLLKPQSDLFLWRKDRFRIRVRPDVVVGVGNRLVAVEFTTAKDPGYISEARFALNHHALIRERLRRSDWDRFHSVATRVEMLALGYGFTIRLDADKAEQWRVAIGKAAEALIAGDYEPNPGEYCSACPWQVPCRFNGEPIEGEEF